MSDSTTQAPANIVIPIYRTALTDDERIALERCFSVLKSYPITFVSPESLDLTPVTDLFPTARVERFDPAFFAGRDGYNHLMLSAEFYERFLAWDYILLCQTDAFVFRDELADWCARGYDYIGAPWPLRPIYSNPLYKIGSRLKSFLLRKDHEQRHIVRNKVGNGGFSLRRTRTIYDLLKNHPERVAYYKERVGLCSRYYEDVFYAVEAPALNHAFRIPTVHEALGFSFDTYPHLCFRMSGGKLPFGCHGYHRRRRWKFWEPYIEETLNASKA